MKGKLIALEGINGCGKDTQMKLLIRRIEDYTGKACISTRNPTDNLSAGLALRKDYLTGKSFCDWWSLALLYAADRYEQYHSSIKPYIDNGNNVVTSRYAISSLAYQSIFGLDIEDKDEYNIERNRRMAKIMYLNNFNIKKAFPDLYIYIDISPELALKRLHDMYNVNDIFENIDDLKSIYDSYRHAINKMGKNPNCRIFVIPGDESINDVHNMIWNVVHPLLNKK